MSPRTAAEYDRVLDVAWACGVGAFAPAVADYMPASVGFANLRPYDRAALMELLRSFPDYPTVVSLPEFERLFMTDHVPSHGENALLAISLAWALAQRGKHTQKPHFFAALSHLHLSITNREPVTAPVVQACTLTAFYALRVELNLCQAEGLAELAVRLAGQAKGVTPDHWSWLGGLKGFLTKPTDISFLPEKKRAMAKDAAAVGAACVTCLVILQAQGPAAAQTYEEVMLRSMSGSTRQPLPDREYIIAASDRLGIAPQFPLRAMLTVAEASRAKEAGLPARASALALRAWTELEPKLEPFRNGPALSYSSTKLCSCLFDLLCRVDKPVPLEVLTTLRSFVMRYCELVQDGMPSVCVELLNTMHSSKRGRAVLLQADAAASAASNAAACSTGEAAAGSSGCGAPRREPSSNASATDVDDALALASFAASAHTALGK